MDPVHAPESREDVNSREGRSATSWVSVCSSGLWKVQRGPIHERAHHQTAASGDNAWPPVDRPRMGSTCRVRVRLKTDVQETPQNPVSDRESSGCDPQITGGKDADATSPPSRTDAALQVPLGDWTNLRLGEGQCDVTEACVEGMRAQEKCEILLSPLGKASEALANLPEGKWTLSATVELHSFTPGRESWEMSPGDKWEWVKFHKEKGGGRFRSGNIWGAADSYSRALKLLITLHNHSVEAEAKREEQRPETEEEGAEGISEGARVPPATPPVFQPGEFKTVKAELHSNLSLCQIKLNQPARARANATKATRLEPGGPKAWYRLGQACWMMDELEQARRAFRRLLELQPHSAVALKALEDVASREKEKNTELRQRMSKMFS